MDHILNSTLNINPDPILVEERFQLAKRAYEAGYSDQIPGFQVYMPRTKGILLEMLRETALIRLDKAEWDNLAHVMLHGRPNDPPRPEAEV